ncbi:MAG: phenylalanine--tRNA ligase subunit beta [Clostridiales bacterium]|nr:phenylalanine--tRNA ligase subunit beta [Clostridiales bacterium]
MKVPMKWIKAYTPCDVDAATFQKNMIMIGNGVEGYEDLGAEISNIVVGRVLTCEKHPDSDHLHVCTVDVGQEVPIQVVCGAPNVEAGQLVPVALVGAHLPGGVKIKKGKLRGVPSEGMICSGDEIGVPPELYPSVGAAGILVFHEDYPVGSDVKPILGLDDTVMDFEVLANRPDCLSVWGIAREAAVACHTEFHKPEVAVKECGGDIHDYVRVDVEDTDLCPRYIARVIRDVRVGPSPLWLRQYLYGAGMRSINNVVDITNFVMLETGHPMHAFDLDMVEGNHIIVRKAKEGEHITTLDGKAHPLTAGQLVICDASKPSCVAGIMGGEESEITEKTHTLMFECAVFDYAQTRLTARALGIRTESSGRFEKGVSARTAMEAINRACQMINELDAGDVVSGIIDIYPNPLEQQIVKASCERIAKRAGVPIKPEEIERILTELHFEVCREGDSLTVKVPDYRQDVYGEADLCEEALRVYGYDHIPSTLLRGETTPGGTSEKMKLRRRLSSMLTGLGFYEIMNYSFVSPKTLDMLLLPMDDPRRNMLAIRNPLGEDTSVMRTTLVPDVLATAARNMNHGNQKARLYELSRIFDPVHKTEEGLPTEKEQLVLCFYGEGESFYTARGAAERILAEMGMATVPVRSGQSYLHPGRTADLLCDNEIVATVGEVHPQVREAFDMPMSAYLVEIDVESIRKLRKAMGEVKALPRYPSVSRDLSLVMPESVEVGPLLEEMKKSAGILLESAGMFDVYRSAVLGPMKKSVSFNFVFRSAEHTLTETEINTAMDAVMKAAAQEKYHAVIRS